jgi:hypothetical protein
MTRRQALTSFIAGILLVEALGLVFLGKAGVDAEAQASAYALLLSVAGLGGSWIFTRFH